MYRNVNKIVLLVNDSLRNAITTLSSITPLCRQPPPSTSPMVVVIASPNQGEVHVTLNYKTLDDNATMSFLKIGVDRNVFGIPSIGNETCGMGPGSTFECPVERNVTYYQGVRLSSSNFSSTPRLHFIHTVVVL